jgi:hypothetical protein
LAEAVLSSWFSSTNLSLTNPTDNGIQLATRFGKLPIFLGGQKFDKRWRQRPMAHGVQQGIKIVK